MPKLTPAQYAKAIAAFLFALGTWAVTNFPDNHDVQTWGGLVGVIATGLATFSVPNAPAPAQTGVGGDLN